MPDALCCLSWTSQPALCEVPAVTFTSQVSGTFSHLPAESQDLNPGHQMADPEHLTSVLDQPFLIPNPELFPLSLLCPDTIRGPSWGPRSLPATPAGSQCLARALAVSTLWAMEATPSCRADRPISIHRGPPGVCMSQAIRKSLAPDQGGSGCYCLYLYCLLLPREIHITCKLTQWGPVAPQVTGNRRGWSTPWAQAHPFLSSLRRPPLTSPCLFYPSSLTAEILVPVGRGGPEGDRGGRQPQARGQRNCAAL